MPIQVTKGLAITVFVQHFWKKIDITLLSVKYTSRTCLHILQREIINLKGEFFKDLFIKVMRAANSYMHEVQESKEYQKT